MTRIAAPVAALATTLAMAACSEPGTSTAFVELGPLRAPDAAPIELAGDAPEAVATLRTELERAGADNVGAMRDALAYRPPDGSRAFAFVLVGCAETGADLEVDGAAITAELTGGEGVACDQANYFLATFTVDRGAVPDSAHPTTG